MESEGLHKPNNNLYSSKSTRVKKVPKYRHDTEEIYNAKHHKTIGYTVSFTATFSPSFLKFVCLLNEQHIYFFAKTPCQKQNSKP